MDAVRVRTRRDRPPDLSIAAPFDPASSLSDFGAVCVLRGHGAGEDWRWPDLFLWTVSSGFCFRSILANRFPTTIWRILLARRFSSRLSRYNNRCPPMILDAAYRLMSRWTTLCVERRKIFVQPSFVRCAD